MGRSLWLVGVFGVVTTSVLNITLYLKFATYDSSSRGRGNRNNRGATAIIGPSRIFAKKLPGSISNVTVSRGRRKLIAGVAARSKSGTIFRCFPTAAGTSITGSQTEVAIASRRNSIARLGLRLGDSNCIRFYGSVSRTNAPSTSRFA